VLAYYKSDAYDGTGDTGFNPDSALLGKNVGLY